MGKGFNIAFYGIGAIMATSFVYTAWQNRPRDYVIEVQQFNAVGALQQTDTVQANRFDTQGSCSNLYDGFSMKPKYSLCNNHRLKVLSIDDKLQ